MLANEIHGNVADGEHAPVEEHVPRRILIVDDNVDAADALQMLLGIDGHRIRVALDGKAALEVISEGYDPEFILLDIGLPDMTGYQVAQQVRAEHPHSLIQIIALTGWGEAEDLVRSHDAGFDAHLVKPIDHDALRQILAADTGRA